MKFLFTARNQIYSWRKVADSPFRAALTIPNQRNSAFACNAFHWIMRDMRSNVAFIAAFDLSTEQFHLVPKPDHGDYSNKNNIPVSLGNLGGCLSILYHVKLEPYAFVDVWALMKDYGVKNSWTKLFTRQLPLGGLPDMFMISVGCSDDHNQQQVLFQINKKFLMQHDFRLNF
ncbi:hypothetical protein ACH5RR_033029 [Cinchona calisaya]|uniref:F-box associated beta-propeller type 1 domain-containing protein n=1 Tax=Cinchona calisaya TaxID=153742 RepID=A0ABD2YP68_9GENT